MGFTLQRSCNLLTALLKNKHDVGALVFTSQGNLIDLNKRLQKLVRTTGFEQVQVSMDRFLKQNNRECVRNTIMKQEQIFKQQVHELHRLYQVQKMLMSELRTKEAQIHLHATTITPRAVTDAKNKHWSSTATSETSHSQLNSEHSSLHQQGILTEEPSHKAFNLEVPAEQKATISHVQPNELWTDEGCDVDLSLSIGCSSSKKKPQDWLHSEPTSGTRKLLLSNAGARQERGEECSKKESLQRPPWLFQAMSLNRT